MPHSDASAPASPIITLQVSRRSLFLGLAGLFAVFAFFFLTVVSVGGFFVWKHFDHERRLTEAKAAFENSFLNDSRQVTSLLSSAELQSRDLNAQIAKALTATRANAIPVDPLNLEAQTMRATQPQLREAVAALSNLEPSLKTQYGLRPQDRLSGPRTEMLLSDLTRRERELSASLDQLPTQLAMVSARRDDLLAQARASAARAAEQRRLAQQQQRQQQAPRPGVEIARPVFIQQPAPVWSVGFSTFNRPIYCGGFHHGGWGGWSGHRHHGFRHHGYRYDCGSRRGGVGISFAVR
jgi:hypothetical protein